MAKYFLTKKAVSGLLGIWDYTVHNWSKNHAEKYYSQLINSFGFLANNPKSGKKYFEVHRNTLGYKSGKHIIFYQLLPSKDIIIIRILHQQMDLEHRIDE